MAASLQAIKLNLILLLTGDLESLTLMCDISGINVLWSLLDCMSSVRCLGL